MGKKKLETTYYRFMSEIRAFLSSLLKNPINAKPHKYLTERDFNKKRLINVLIKRDILERHEKILDSTNSDEKEAKYVVKYKVRKKDFEKKIHRIYIQYFEKNLPEKREKVDEREEKVEMPLIRREIYNPKMKKIYITEKQFQYIQECINNVNRADILNEDGEAAGATAGDIGQWGSGDTPIRTTNYGSKKKKNIGGFAFDEDFVKGSTTSSAPITTLNKK